MYIQTYANIYELVNRREAVPLFVLVLRLAWARVVMWSPGPLIAGVAACFSVSHGNLELNSGTVSGNGVNK